MPCSLKHERTLWQQGIERVAGIDEAGRGPLAGPVVAATVILTEKFRLKELDDSKKLAAKKRDELYSFLVSEVEWTVAVFTHEEVDRLNILGATHEAMRDAVMKHPLPAHHALIDGLPVPRFPIPHTALVGGDALSKSIAAASVIAKVTRDRIMEEMDQIYPQYGFAKHKGYATAEHLAKLRDHGPCPIHRQSFEPVAQQYLF
ncbi:MAG: ribonuclease HII [Verrucomicrobia bacterium 61-8]|nr:ribonuclease HII [Verrucomicrobiota bacterium]OJV12528.1 MAG: ribonuclease HII [Verrucomicrobia bacterium 61-8]